jgi:hypothetical protein
VFNSGPKLVSKRGCFDSRRTLRYRDIDDIGTANLENKRISPVFKIYCFPLSVVANLIFSLVITLFWVWKI